jgi:hypothetical protein
MKRALVAAALGGLLLVGTPTLALSAQRNDTRAEKGADKGGDKGRGGEKGDRGHRGDKADRGDRGDRDGRHGHDRGRHRHGHRHGDYYDNYYGYPYYGGYHGGGYYGGGYYGDPYYYNRHGAGRDGYVVVHGMAFNPPEVHIRPGGHVTWQFNDRAPHTVTADNNSFNSGERGSGEFRLYFSEPGTYSYHCAIHPEMKGRVIVG